MKNLFTITLLVLFSNNLFIYSQEVSNQKYYPEKPNYSIPKNHDPNFLKLNKLPAKSFYESKSDWQHIIDSTWGPGDPLPQKLLIFNTFAQQVHDQFDGFLSLQLNWDSLKSYYLNQINASTSKGAFSSIMSHFSYDLKDYHTRAVDTSVVQSPLNPGVPVLLLGSYLTVEHFGAVTTVLEDSTTLILRVVPNHPLSLEPGDIILGYEGIPWKELVQELFNAGLPIFAHTGGCKTADTYLNLFGAGINWHLFNTIDILKHSSGDTVHLSVLPLLNLNVPPMANNEQLPIPNIPFPDVISWQCVTYGILENTNIGYIYLAQEWPEEVADYQFYEAVNSLKNTDALIIDMRLNYGGWALFNNAFRILFNESQNTLEEAYRCNPNTFDLCSGSWWQYYRIDGMAPEYYDRPIAVLLGPTCVSMGDLTAQRLRYHPMIRFFGASSDASLGINLFIENFPDWYIRYSIGDTYHLSKPDEYLNRREFPIDFPVWHNPDDVAMGKDAVVEKSLEWINNVVYPHNTVSDKIYYLLSQDTVHLSTTIENPNSHQLSARAYLKTVEGVLIDSVDFVKQTLNPEGEQWTTNLSLPPAEELYKISITSFDQTTLEQFNVPNVTRYTNAGPLVVDSILYVHLPAQRRYSTRPYISNLGNSLPIKGVLLKITCEDPWIVNFPGVIVSFPTIQPGATAISNSVVGLYYDSTFSGYFDLKFEIMSNGWPYWTDTLIFYDPNWVGIEDELNEVPTEFLLSQNYPNPFNPSTTFRYSIPKSSQVTLKIINTLGEELQILVNEEKPVGTYELNWNAANLPSGVYFYRLQAGDYVQTRKMILLK
jgi:hypothetical protein